MRLHIQVEGRPAFEVIAAPVFVEPAAHDGEGLMWRARFHAHAVPIAIELISSVRGRSGGAFPLNWEAVEVSVPHDALLPSVDFLFIEAA